MPAPTVVIVGAGQAGSQTATSLREEGFAGRIILIGDEPHLPYQRPPLSKGHITGNSSRDRLWLHPRSFYEQHEVEVLLSERVTTIDRAAGTVLLDSGVSLGYDHLVIATGARNRSLPLQGAALDGVVGLRTLTEADDIRCRLADVSNVVVVGGGFIGLEVASTAVKLKIPTVVVELADRLMGRVLSPRMGDYLLDAHRSRGLHVELGVNVANFSGRDGRVTTVTTSDGREFPADLVLVGVGAVPNTELADAAGLPTDNGILVDEFLTTADPRISAVGDCAACPNPYAQGRIVRLESVHNATAQPRCLAARIAGTPEPYHSVPWFWSDQADLKLQIAGLTTGSDESVVRGSPADGKFSVFCFDDGTLRAVESLNRPGDHMASRKLLSAGGTLTPEQAADTAFDLKAHIATLV